MIGSTGERVLRASLAHADAWNVWYDLYGNTLEGFARENTRSVRSSARPDENPPTSCVAPRCSSPSRVAGEIDRTLNRHGFDAAYFESERMSACPRRSVRS